MEEIDNKYRGFRRPTHEDYINQAYEGVKNDNRLSPEEKKWLTSIIFILEKKGYARVMADGCFIDIEALRGTDRYASFYDVYNRIENFNTSVMPIKINELVNPFKLLYEVKYGRQNY